MLAWLYDEDRWPSGAAGGIVTKDRNYRQRFILFTCDEDYTPIDNDAILLARFDIVLGDDNCLASYKLLGEGEKAEGTEWSIWREIAKDNPQ